MESILRNGIANMIVKMELGELQIVDYLLDWNFGFSIAGIPESQDIEKYYNEDVDKKYLQIAEEFENIIYEIPKCGGAFSCHEGTIYLLIKDYLGQDPAIGGWLSHDHPPKEDFIDLIQLNQWNAYVNLAVDIRLKPGLTVEVSGEDLNIDESSLIQQVFSENISKYLGFDIPKVKYLNLSIEIGFENGEFESSNFSGYFVIADDIFASSEDVIYAIRISEFENGKTTNVDKIPVDRSSSDVLSLLFPNHNFTGSSQHYQ